MMHSCFSVLVNVLSIVSLISGHPFSFLPRYALDRSAHQRSLDRQSISHTSNLLSPLSEYEGQAIPSKPVQPWTKIGLNPVNGLETSVGSRVELECRASGSPPPEVLWFTGSGTNEQLIEYVRSSTQNFFNPQDEWKGVARINSKLVIECVTPEDAGLIYCASISAHEVKLSTPTLLMVNGGHGPANCSTESEPTITLYSPTRVANIGSSIVLPCRASGKPVPQISWVDNYNVPIGVSSNPRYRVLDNGDLLIQDLEWEDMGGYTCMAKSGHSQQVVSTFLYPLRPESDLDRSMN